MKPIRTKEGMQLIAVILAAGIGSALIDTIPSPDWQGVLKATGLLLVAAAIYKIGA